MKYADELPKELVEKYLAGESIGNLANFSEMSATAIEMRLRKAGIIRNRAQAMEVYFKRKRESKRFEFSRLSENENGPWAAKLSQEYLSKSLRCAL